MLMESSISFTENWHIPLENSNFQQKYWTKSNGFVYGQSVLWIFIYGECSPTHQIISFSLYVYSIFIVRASVICFDMAQIMPKGVANTHSLILHKGEVLSPNFQTLFLFLILSAQLKKHLFNICMESKQTHFFPQSL